MLVNPLEHVMHETVMPWLLERIGDFLNDDDFIHINTNEVVRDAFEMGKEHHRLAITHEYTRK